MRQFWSTFRVFFRFGYVWHQRVVLGSQKWSFGVPFAGLRRRFGVVLMGFGAMLKIRDSSSIIVNDFVKLRIGSSTWEYSSVLTDTQGYLGEVLWVIVEYSGIRWNT